MSIMEYFSKPVMGQAEDSLFPIYRELVALRGALPTLRQQQLLECCGAAMGKGSEVKLTVVDQELFSRLDAEIKTKEARVVKITEIFGKVDALVAEVQAKGIMLSAPTATGIRRAARDADNRIYSMSTTTRNTAIEAISRGASLSDVTLDLDPSLKETADYMKDVEQRCNSILGEL